MAPSRDALRAQIRNKSDSLTPADREALLKPYLPDPADLSTTRAARSRRKPRKTPIRTFIKSQVHRLAYALTHIIFGIVIRLVQAYHAVVDRILAVVYHHHRTPELIRKDVRSLKRLPQHLSVILTLRKEDDALAVLMDEVAELTAWCTCAGIAQLSVYEKTGILKSCIPALHQIISTKLTSYHGTQQPSLQLYAPHHAVYGNATASNAAGDSIALLLLSSTDGRETIVDLTKTLAEMSQNGKLSPQDITPELVDAEITEITAHPLRGSTSTSTNTRNGTNTGTNGAGDAGRGELLKPEPDLLLVFGPFLKLDGYPPWQLRLTEMYCTGDRSNSGDGEAVEYQGFMRGLWHYAGAQMRFGR